MITWYIHTNDYGMYSFDHWWLTEDEREISPICPAETDIKDIDYYTEGRRVDRIVRTKTIHGGDYALVGRGFDGRAQHVVAVECNCTEY